MIGSGPSGFRCQVLPPLNLEHSGQCLAPSLPCPNAKERVRLVPDPRAIPRAPCDSQQDTLLCFPWPCPQGQHTGPTAGFQAGPQWLQLELGTQVETLTLALPEGTARTSRAFNGQTPKYLRDPKVQKSQC